MIQGEPTLSRGRGRRYTLRKFSRRNFLKSTAALAATRVYLPIVKVGGASTPLNVILVVADDLGWADIGPYGQSIIPTPNLDYLAQNGARMTRFYSSSPVCSPSRFGLLTGKHLGRTSHVRNWVPFGANDVLLPELLKNAGYQTAIIGKWANGRLGDNNSPASYFDYSFGYVDHEHAHDSWTEHLIEDGNYYWMRENRHERKTFIPDVIEDKISQFINVVERPFFLYVPLTLPHANNEDNIIEVPDTSQFDAYDWPDSEKRYASLVARIDGLMGTILASLGDRLDNTLVLFTADNGPHSDAGHKPNFFNGNPFRGQKGLLYDGGIRVPLIAHCPSHIPGGIITDQVGWFPDLFATIASLCGVNTGLMDIDGIPMDSYWQGSQTEASRRFYWRFERQGVMIEAAIIGRWKGVRYENSKLALYNLDGDYDETTDYSDMFPEVAEQMVSFMEHSGS